MNQPDTLDLTLVPFYEWDTFVAPKNDDEVNVGVSMMDSVFAPRETPQPVLRQSLFRGHTLKVTDNKYINRETTTPPAWIFAVVLLIIALICYYYRRHGLNIRTVVQMIFDNRAMERTLRENNLMHNIHLIPIGMLATIPLSVAIFHMAMMETGIVGFGILALLLTAAYYVRWWIMRMLGATFNNGTAVNLYIINGYLYHLLLATAVIPPLLLQLYLPDAKEIVFYIIAALVAIVFIARIFRGMRLFFSNTHTSYLYLFYYLCIVEIIPILVLIKWFIS